MRKHPVK